MNYISTKDKNELVSFEEAVVKGLALNKALFMPERIPVLPRHFWEEIARYTDHEIAFEALFPFVKDSIDEPSLKKIIAETISFPTPTVFVEENIYSLELFHGPTKAFKDVGARFMSRCLAHFVGKSDKKVTILVATSGDTGSAVANGFYNVTGVDVVILFPKGKVSPYQEFQMTSLGGNIRAVEVDGVFDDCQALVKEAFSDIELNQRLNLSSANSINIARLLPQMLYYFFAYKELKKKDKKIVFSVPSGNFGNLTAGIIAKKMGLPVQFIAATNSNDTFRHYMETGEYLPKASVSTYSNAMDVGAPSNFERLMHLYDSDLKQIRRDIQAESIDDAATLKEIEEVYKKSAYLLDPHGAVGIKSLRHRLKEGQIGVFLETAHPKKFEEVVQKAIPNYPKNEVDLGACKKECIGKEYIAFKTLLQERNNK
ncbi:threonine synthase [Aureispira anguillae]|uniref:Threonine synthase n=1 Tax=Aureispira anguillae TaxID=2864201 RepID=A0A915YDP4_9BACT|nr:threonine synthase [Aureispira anguillae]BDS11164.1 threonine synthase [Aureispira anguillae]